MGCDNKDQETTLGYHSMRTRNENGELFTDFCMTNNLVIGGSIFPHKEIHKATWYCPHGITRNEIDHIAISRRYRRFLYDVRV